MASKRARSPELVANPFIKKRNLAWSLDDFPEPTSSRTSPSPPAKRRPSRAGPPAARQEASPQQQSQPPGPAAPSSAAIEAGKARITNHAEHFASLLSSHALRRPFPAGAPRLSVRAYRALFESSLGSPTAAHFVVHQHDHPVAGTHYDLRLQINGSSSASWAVMYGLPGAPNGARQARNATETRVHCLWNHLVETASRETGSLLIWDTGTYSVLPAPRARETRYRRRRRRSSLSDREEEEEEGEKDERTEQQKLAAAFAARKIRVRLDGTRLPRPYVLYLRLTKDEDAAGRAKAARSAWAPRRRTRRTRTTAPAPEETSSSSSNNDSSDDEQDHDDDGEVVDPGQTVAAAAEAEEISAMDRELRELEDAEVRRTNAYPGATNSIGSVHQRKWYLSMDREACGFVRRRRHGKVVWEEEEAKGQEDDAGQADRGGDSTIASSSRLTYPFFVRGVEHERSVVTGRLGAEILRDEGITDYVGRMGWRPVLR